MLSPPFVVSKPVPMNVKVVEMPVYTGVGSAVTLSGPTTERESASNFQGLVVPRVGTFAM
jgi:hypothetical protein